MFKFHGYFNLTVKKMGAVFISKTISVFLCVFENLLFLNKKLMR